LRFFFESLQTRTTTDNRNVGGVSAQEGLEFLANTPILSARQIETALTIAALMTDTFAAISPFGTALGVVSAVNNGLTIARFVSRVGGAVIAGNNIVNRLTLERSLRGHLDNNFAAFSERGFMSRFLFNGPGLNGAGNAAINQAALYLRGAGFEGTRIQDLINDT